MTIHDLYHNLKPTTLAAIVVDLNDSSRTAKIRAMRDFAERELICNVGETQALEMIEEASLNGPICSAS